MSWDELESRRDYDRELRRRDDYELDRRRDRAEFDEAMTRAIRTGDYSRVDAALGLPPADSDWRPASVENDSGAPAASSGDPSFDSVMAEARESMARLDRLLAESDPLAQARDHLLRLIVGCAVLPAQVLDAWHATALEIDWEGSDGGFGALRRLQQDLVGASIAYAPRPDVWNLDLGAVIRFDQETAALGRALAELDDILTRGRPGAAA